LKYKTGGGKDGKGAERGARPSPLKKWGAGGVSNQPSAKNQGGGGTTLEPQSAQRVAKTQLEPLRFQKLAQADIKKKEGSAAL